MRMTGKFIENLNLTGHVGIDHTGQVAHRHTVGLSDGDREALRQYLQASRDQRQPPERLLSINGSNGHVIEPSERD